MRARFGPFFFDSETRELTRDGHPLSLSPKAFALLEALIEASPSPLSKETLYERLWPDTFVEPGNLHNLVSEIRAALGDGDREIIRTVHRFGYSLAGPAGPDDPLRYSIILGREEHPLREGINIIGRDPAAAVSIDAPEVSRHHARLIIRGGEIKLEDLGSKNGTFLGSTRVKGTVSVKDGDDIIIGRAHLRLRVGRTLATTVTWT